MLLIQPTSVKHLLSLATKLRKKYFKGFKFYKFIMVDNKVFNMNFSINIEHWKI
jgi:hypothetical protein